MAHAQDFGAMPGPLGFSRGFLNQQPTTLVMKEKSGWSGDDFTVKTTEGQDIVRVEGKAMSMSQRKLFYSASGQHLFTLRKHTMGMFGGGYIEAPDGQQIVEFQGRASFKAKIDVHFTNTCVDPPQPATLEVRGDFGDRSADITWNGVSVARVRRDHFKARDLFLNKQTYAVEIAPNVDVALIAAVVVGIDEQRNDNKGGFS